MSDQDKGYQGVARDGFTNELDYMTGQAARENQTPNPPASSSSASSHPAYDYSTGSGRVSEPSARLPEPWAEDADSALKGMLKALIIAPIVGAGIGTALGAYLGDAWTKTGALTWGFNLAGVFLWFVGLIVWVQILRATLDIRVTRRGLLTLLFLGGFLAYMVWAFATARAFA